MAGSYNSAVARYRFPVTEVVSGQWSVASAGAPAKIAPGAPPSAFGLLVDLRCGRPILAASRGCVARSGCGRLAARGWEARKHARPCWECEARQDLCRGMCLTEGSNRRGCACGIPSHPFAKLRAGACAGNIFLGPKVEGAQEWGDHFLGRFTNPKPGAPGNRSGQWAVVSGRQDKTALVRPCWMCAIGMLRLRAPETPALSAQHDSLVSVNSGPPSLGFDVCPD